MYISISRYVYIYIILNFHTPTPHAYLLSLSLYMYMYLYMYACMCNLFSLVIPMHQKFGMLPDSEGFSMGPIVGQYQTSMVSLDAPRRGLASKTGHGFP